MSKIYFIALFSIFLHNCASLSYCGTMGGAQIAMPHGIKMKYSGTLL